MRKRAGQDFQYFKLPRSLLQNAVRNHCGGLNKMLWQDASVQLVCQGLPPPALMFCFFVVFCGLTTIMLPTLQYTEIKIAPRESYIPVLNTCVRM